MQAETLNCPMCGAAASSNSDRCEHCGARLALVACPSCFSMIFLGATYCSHCGAKADRTELGSDSLSCPRCRVAMSSVVLGAARLQECGQCGGLWVDTISFQRICSDREQQATVLGAASPLTEPEASSVEHNIRYLPCPVCRQLMNRVNFARCSHVVVDVCRRHGTWFDKNELHQIIEFIRAGGLEAARTRELAELEERRRQLNAAQVAQAWDSRVRAGSPFYEDCGRGISGAASILKLFLP
jgi:Zn-finger nucleic acid-binding protein